MSRDAPIVASKIGPPMLASHPAIPTAVERRIPSDVKVVSIVAPPGYGKTVLAERLHGARPPGTAAWLSVDLLDRWPFSFWSHLLAALRATDAGIDDEPLAILTERGPGSGSVGFVGALCAQLLRAPEPVTLVLDDVDRVDDVEVLAGLEFLVERSADRLRVVLTGRVDPALPLARWRSHGHLFEVRQSDLRFDRSTARRFVASRAPGVLGGRDVDALNERVEGWPMGLQVALLVARDATVPSDAVREITGTHRKIADYVTDEVIASLAPAERELALGLSVLRWFDVELCSDVLGDDALPLVRRLVERQLVAVSAGGYRFHALIRELLEAELTWRDPGRREWLHRRAADVLRSRGDPFGAARHLAAVGDEVAAGDAVAADALAAIDRGLVPELRRALAALPDDLVTADPETVIDVAFAQLMVGRRSETRVWVERAVARTPASDRRATQRLVTLRLTERTLFADVEATLALIEESDRQHGRSADTWRLGGRHELILARSAVHFRLPDAPDRIATARRSPAPDVVVETVAAALDALLAIRGGDLAAARRASAHSTARASELSSDEHPAMYESLLAAGWCALGAGELGVAREYADRSRAHPLAVFPTYDVEVGLLSSMTSIAADDADAALALLDQIDGSARRADFLRSEVATVRARALESAGRREEAMTILAGEDPSADRDIVLAWCLFRIGRSDEARAIIGSSSAWPTQLRLEALLLEAMLTEGGDRDPLIRGGIQLADRSGWVAPLLGHGSDVDAALALVRGVARTSTPEVAPASGSAVELTDRERTLLTLLPTHLSYAQMGEQLYVSVNTIKSNLKSTYRKLGAGSRDEAIRVARSHGLLDQRLTLR